MTTFTSYDAETERRFGVAATADVRGEQLIVTLVEDIDCATSAGLFGLLLAILVTSTAPHLVVDLAGLDFCDGAGARMFTRLHQAAVNRGGTCHLRNPRPHIRWLLNALDAGYLLDPAQTGETSDRRHR